MTVFLNKAWFDKFYHLLAISPDEDFTVGLSVRFPPFYALHQSSQSLGSSEAIIELLGVDIEPF
jgi:hypothetical protein